MNDELLRAPTGDIAIAAGLAFLPALALALIGYGLHRVVVPRLSLSTLAEGTSLRRVIARSMWIGALIGLLALMPVPSDLAILTAAIALSVSAALIAWRAREPLPAALFSVSASALGMLLDAAIIALALTTGVTHGAHMSVAWQVLLWWPFVALPALAASCISGTLSTLQMTASADSYAATTPTDAAAAQMPAHHVQQKRPHSTGQLQLGADPQPSAEKMGSPSGSRNRSRPRYAA